MSDKGKIQASSTLNVEREPGQLSTPLKAIRSHCLGCCGGIKEVALCTITTCPLWPYRFASRNRSRKIIAEERALCRVDSKWWAEQLHNYTEQTYYGEDKS